MPTAVDVIYLTDKLTVFSSKQPHQAHTQPPAAHGTTTSSFIPSPYIVIGDSSGDVHVVKISHEFGPIQDAGGWVLIWVCGVAVLD